MNFFIIFYVYFLFLLSFFYFDFSFFIRRPLGATRLWSTVAFKSYSHVHLLYSLKTGLSIFNYSDIHVFISAICPCIWVGPGSTILASLALVPWASWPAGWRPPEQSRYGQGLDAPFSAVWPCSLSFLTTNHPKMGLKMAIIWPKMLQMSWNFYQTCISMSFIKFREGRF